MSARDVIYGRLTHLPGPHKFRDLSILGIATEAEEALIATGYRILGPDEVDPVTVERCASVVAPAMNKDGPYAFVVEAAIRAIASGGKQ